MKVVFDTNVLISRIFFAGPPKSVIEAWIDGRIDVVVSLEILDEYRRVLDELSGQFPDVDTSGMLDFLTVNSLIWAVESLDEQICDDPDDDKFLACALASGAGVLVTGDKALLRVERLRGLRILRPRSFPDEYLSSLLARPDRGGPLLESALPTHREGGGPGARFGLDLRTG